MSREPANGDERVDATRMDAVDALRGVAMAAVVAHHVSWRMLARGTFAAPGAPVFAAVYLVSDFGVPLFVALSAFLLAWRDAASGRSGGYGAALARRARRLLPAYVLWSVVSLAARDVALLASPAEVGRSLLFGTADVQLYYVPMLFELLLLWPLLRPLLVRRTIAGAAVVLAGGAIVADLAWRGMLVPLWTPLVLHAVAVATGAGLPFVLATPGRTRAGAGKAMAIAAVLFAVAVAALAVSVGGFVSSATPADTRADLYLRALAFPREQAVAATALTIALALLAVRFGRSRAFAVLAALGRASYGVFLLHLLVASTLVYRVVGLDALVTAPLAAAVLGMTAAWALTLAVSWLLSRLLARHRALAWTVGGGRA